MNSDTIKGDWKQMRGQVKEAFGKLTDDDLLVAEGNVEQLTGAIQKRYGYTREKAAEEWTAFTERTANGTANTADVVRGRAANAAEHVRGAAASTVDAVRGAAGNAADAVRGAAATGAAAASEAAAKAARVIDPTTNKDARPELRDR